MTESELRAKYIQAYRIIKAERRMCERVFRVEPIKLNAKLVEIDMLLEIVEWMKDELKAHCEAGVEQMALIEPPTRYE